MGRERRRHSSSAREARLRRKLLFARLVAIGAIVCAVVLSMMLIRTEAERASADAESRILTTDLHHAQTELDQAKRLLAAQDVELGAQVKQRIPGALSLEIDKLYDIDSSYFKKVSFSESGVDADKRLTYYAVLKNAEAAPVQPAAVIHLFDHTGLQIGLARIQLKDATTPASTAELLPGETRTYSAPVEITRKGEPGYFLVELQ
jgi:hypothetical protein